MTLFTVAFFLAALSTNVLSVDQNDHKLTLDELREGIETGHQFVKDLNKLEANMNPTRQRDAYAGYGIFFPVAIEQSKKAAVQLVARQHLSDKFGVPAAEIDFNQLGQISDRQNPLPPVPSTCNATYLYRSFDGTCNNLNNPRYGQSQTIFQRLMGPANYADGVSKIRLSITGAPLPSTRLVSTTVTFNESLPDSGASFITMQWGQFLDHDLTQTAGTTTSTGAAISCCDGGRFGNNTANPHPECMAIPIPSNDPVYSNVDCMNFVRSAYGLNLDGSTPPNREQINGLTHWIDGSQIYGNNAAAALALRDNSTGKGLLKTSSNLGQQMLPLTTTCCPGDPTNSCPDAKSCFFAGDSRVREQSLLTVMHTIWLREHNRVANELFNLYGTAKSDEFYYQEARRIVIAEFQHITYNEYLPVILGPLSSTLTTSSGNNAPANPAIYNEFAAAAYRMGHSQLRSFIRLFEADGRKSRQSYFLANSFNNGSRLLVQNFTDNAIRGLLQNMVQSVDECFADDLTSQLFRTPAIPLGGDLVSINMQRGRDHGLPPYVKARQIASGGSLPNSFEDLSPIISASVINSLKMVYASVQDIDLYIGGVSEAHIPGALVGPTFGHIISKQFQNLKYSDRFFYSTTTNSVSFTKKQVKELQKTSLARIICDNNDGSITQVQPKAFRPSTAAGNAPVSCSQIPSIDLSLLTSVSSSSDKDDDKSNEKD